MKFYQFTDNQGQPSIGMTDVTTEFAIEQLTKNNLKYKVSAVRMILAIIIGVPSLLGAFAAGVIGFYAIPFFGAFIFPLVYGFTIGWPGIALLYTTAEKYQLYQQTLKALNDAKRAAQADSAAPDNFKLGSWMAPVEVRGARP
jgi:hypothetical protein